MLSSPISHLPTFAVEVQFVMKRLEADAQQLRRAGLIVFRLLNRAQNPGLQLFNRLPTEK